MPVEWDHIPSLRELKSYRSTDNPNDCFPIYPGVEYCWVLATNRKTAMDRESWTALRGVDVFTIGGHAVVLMGRGEPIAGARLDCTEPILRIDPELLVKMRPVTNDKPAAVETEKRDRQR
jgi:hypothetical protein